MPDQSEIEFLEDINALLSQTIEQQLDPWAAIKALADEVRERIGEIDEG